MTTESITFDCGDYSTSVELFQLRKIDITGRQIILCVIVPDAVNGFDSYELLPCEVDPMEQAFFEEKYLTGELGADPIPPRYHDLMRRRLLQGGCYKAFKLVV
jgi:hypothetical protein